MDNTGYTDTFEGNALQQILRTESLGRRAVLLTEVDSTNLEARRLAEIRDEKGTVVIAARQTQGRGRRGRNWVSESGCGLWMTAILRPAVPTEALQQVTLLAAVSVCQAVHELAGEGIRLQIKWPNDVLTQGKKLCGILCETVTDGEGCRSVLVGIGVNTRTPPMGYGKADAVAISLQQASGRAIPRLRMAAEILNQMEALSACWQQDGFAPVAALYRRFMVPVGTEVVLIDTLRGKHGRIIGLEDDGCLVVRLEDGTCERVISGEISLRGVGNYV